MKEKLQQVFSELNATFFEGKVRINEIRLMRRRSKRIWGRFNKRRLVIEINPVLFENEEVLRYTVFHEMCHAKMIFRKKNHRWHTKRFYQLLNQYPNHFDVKLRFMLWVEEYQFRIGYIKERKLNNALEVGKNVNEIIKFPCLSQGFGQGQTE